MAGQYNTFSFVVMNILVSGVTTDSMAEARNPVLLEVKTLTVLRYVFSQIHANDFQYQCTLSYVHAFKSVTVHESHTTSTISTTCILHITCKSFLCTWGLFVMTALWFSRLFYADLTCYLSQQSLSIAK